MTTYTFRNDQPGRGTADEFLTILREVGQWLVDSGQEMWEINRLISTHQRLAEYFSTGGQ